MSEMCPYCNRVMDEKAIEARKQMFTERKKISSARMKETLKLKKDAGEPIGRPRKFNINDLRDRIIDLDNRGYSRGDMRIILQCNYRLLQEVLGPAKIGFRAIHDKQNILAMAEAGLSREQISLELKCHPNTVYRAIKGTGEFKRVGGKGTRGKLVYCPKFPLIEESYETDDSRPWLDELGLIK